MRIRSYPDYSQFGEDKIIEKILGKIGIKNRYCLEIGAGDGRQLSNTLVYRELGWSALLIEMNPNQIQDLLNNAGENSTVVFGEITDLDSQLLMAEAPVDLDFASIDVDGQDYWLWHDMEKYRPRIMCIEYNPYVNTDGYHPTKVVGRGEHGQTARQPLMELAEEKGYEFMEETYCNLIFVDKNELHG
jgi:hypothetical protein